MPRSLLAGVAPNWRIGAKERARPAALGGRFRASPTQPGIPAETLRCRSWRLGHDRLRRRPYTEAELSARLLLPRRGFSQARRFGKRAQVLKTRGTDLGTKRVCFL